MGGKKGKDKRERKGKKNAGTSFSYPVFFSFYLKTNERVRERERYGKIRTREKKIKKKKI